jgi:3-hydroxyacyl-CoA dehydrogenase
MTIEKAAVIGAGVMGSGIAAQIANAGIPVVLLDIVAKNGPDRSAIAKGAVARMLKADPAPFMHASAARLVTPGNLEDDLALLEDCDWIVEAVLEDPGVKKALYERLESVRKPDAVVSSNTSTIPLRLLTEGRSEGFRKHFIITHFFNPPRYMRLLEIVPGEAAPETVAPLRDFADRRLGKGVVVTKDTPGFIANRIGGYWIAAGLAHAIELGLDIEEADVVMGRPFGFPKTGIFGLLDLVGIDLMPHVGKSMRATLPKDDPYQKLGGTPALVERMIAEGYTGRKGKGGFYRLDRAGGKREKQAIDLATGAYRSTREARLGEAKKAAAVLQREDKAGEYARRVMLSTLAYAAALVPEIADHLVAVDEAMRLGYNWKKGPFELIDEIGVDAFAAALGKAGIAVPKLVETAKGKSFYRVEKGRLEYLATSGAWQEVKRAEGVLLLEDVKRRTQSLARNGSASLWDIGDGVACLEFHSKMNALDTETVALLRQAIETVKKGMKALVVYNEGANFSVGANIGLALYAANIAAWPMIEEMIAGGQKIYKALKYAPFPVVAAPSGMALGGGCEILLHSDAVQAHAESYVGLVETGVGLVPGWGGCKEMITRWIVNKKRPGGPMPAVSQAFETIALAKVAKSAMEARDLLFLRPEDGITMNRDRLLADAKAKALALAKDYKPPEPQKISLPGPTAHAALGLAVGELQRQGKATPHDGTVAGVLAEVISGGDTDIVDELSEDQLYALERRAFMGLLRNPKTLARMEHMLETGKPLRN